MLEDAISALHLLSVLNASPHLSCKETAARQTAITDLPLLVTDVLAALKDASNALKISSVSTALITCSCTEEAASIFAQLEPSETDHQAIGNVSLAIPPVRLA